MKSNHLLFILCASFSAVAAAAPIKVALVSDSEDLRESLTRGGAQIVDSWNAADVLVLQSASGKPIAGVDQAAVEAVAKRGAGVVVLGGAIGAGGWMKPIAGAASNANTRSFPSLMMLYPHTDAHPITSAASAFDLTDETTYDLDIDPAAKVIGSAFTPKVTSEKKDKRAPEKLDRANVYDVQPQLWTYEGADQHRAFTCLQAGTEALKHPSIRSIILRGVAWTAKRPNTDELCSGDDLGALRYPPGGPRRGEDTVKSFALPPGFTATSIATEPLINKAIAIQWDGRGRLWVAETPEYPNGRRPSMEPAWKETGVLKPNEYDRPATDRISVLEDANGDGVMDKKSVFHTGLELVTGFCLWKDGVIAVGQPDIVFIHGEGAEQKVDRLFTGFTPGDTHFVANHFIVAPDGWIYANTGSSADAVSVTHPGVKARVSPGVFRFKPDGSAIEVVGSKGGNGFGLDITSDGEIYFGQATSGNPVQHVVLPEWVLAKGKAGNAGSVQTVFNQRKVVREDMPSRVPYMQIDVVGGYSAACASTVQEGGAWPAQWNDMVFCTEPILDIIHAERLKASGPTFAGEMENPSKEWLRSQDWWFFPIDVQFGPDGAMYVLDFYNPIVAHSDSRGPKHSRSGATIRPDREHYFGRIYRIQSTEAKKLESHDLSKASTPDLVKAFSHPSKLVRFNAHRLFMDRADAATAVPQLAALAKEEKFAPARSLALWALLRLEKLSPETLASALRSEDAGIRKSALLIAEAQAERGAANLSPLLDDADARVRLLAIRAMSAMPLQRAGAAALLAVLPKLEDDWSRSAAIAAAASNAGPVLEAALAAPGTPAPALVQLAASLAARLAEQHDQTTLAKVIAAASEAPASAAPVVIAILQNGASKLPAGNVAGTSEALAKLLASPDVIISASALPYAVAWDQSGALKGATARRIETLLPVLTSGTESDAVRSAATLALTRSRSADVRIIPSILGAIKGTLPDVLLLDYIGALAATGDPTLGAPLVELLPNLSSLGQAALFDALVTRSEWSNAILDALASKKFAPALLGPPKLSKLRLHPDSAVAKRAQQFFAEVGAGTNAAKDEIIAKLTPEIENKAGDFAKGKEFFANACATCHRLGNVGKDVGPVLDGIGVHGTHELLVHIVDPSRVVDNEHRTWNLTLKNGQFATGIIARENETTVTLKLPGGIMQDVQAADIKSRQDTGMSLMPEGLEALGADGLRDVLAYLANDSGKYRALNLGEAFTTNTGGGLYASREAIRDTVQPVKYGIVKFEGVPFSLPDPSTTPTGGNVIVLRNGSGKDTYAGTMPSRVEIPVGYPAGNIHFLGGVAGWGGGPDSRKPAMKVTIEHADGKTEVEELHAGDVFLDYISSAEVPGSKRVPGVTKQAHVRYFSLPVADRAPIKRLVLESYGNGIAPTTLAITTDNEAPKARK